MQCGPRDSTTKKSFKMPIELNYHISPESQETEHKISTPYRACFLPVYKINYVILQVEVNRMNSVTIKWVHGNLQSTLIYFPCPEYAEITRRLPCMIFETVVSALSVLYRRSTQSDSPYFAVTIIDAEQAILKNYILASGWFMGRR